ncbi:DinB family protein [Gracilimonas sp.]|uniref:DinB family protein n=1 Tax=Gracilimonas sp. TaxID=1974203 RepID=UPI0032EB867B
MTIDSVSSFIDYYHNIRKRTDRLLSVIQPEHLDWTYSEGKFTIADIIRHIAAIERYMYAETVIGNPSRYKGCDKKLADGYEEVMAFYKISRQESLEVFQSLNDEDLKKKCLIPGRTKITIWKWLRAMVEHEVHHRGQLYIYLNMIGVETPPMFGMTEEELRKVN